MKVKKLIEQLQKCDPDLYVYIYKDDNIFNILVNGVENIR